MPKKEIQVPVIITKGEKQLLVVKEINITPLSPPIWRIKDIDKEVIIYNIKVGVDKVILNGYIDKNINYKVKKHCDKDSVDGPLYHHTTRIPFATFIDVPGAKECDNCEILYACVEVEKDELIDPIPDTDTYNKVLEKMVVKIVVKITRTEHLWINVDC